MPHDHHQSCCISHLFSSAATKTPTQIAVIHSTSTATRSLISSSPPIYEGDLFFTYADVISAVDSFSRRIRRVLDGGDDPDLSRPKGRDFIHDNERVSNLGGAISDMQSPMAHMHVIYSFSSNPRVIGVHITPSVEYVVAVLSILRCGEAFLPLDPLWPEERILSVVSSSRACLVIGCPPVSSMHGTLRSDAVDWVVNRSSCSVLHLSMGVAIEEQIAHPDLVWPCESQSPRKFCYLMYTSGSTGKPKGVCGTEAGLLNRFWWMQDQFPLSKADVLLFRTSVSFVDHLQEFLSAILTSSPLVVPVFDEFKANPLYIVDLIKAYGISRLTSVPSLMRTIVRFEISVWMSIRKSLKMLVLSGEILSVSLWEILHELLPGTTILNLYGSTEVSGDCTYFDCKNLFKILEDGPLHSVPIGVPISNCNVEIVGKTNKPDEGEIFVGGTCLFMGYLGEPFCGHSISDSPSMYFRTGDFAKRLQSGDLIFIGRKDRTIKLNGQRMALEEIENAIREHPEVSDAAVVFQQVHGQLPELQAFFVMKTTRNRNISNVDKQPVEELIASIRSWLLRKLPLAMIPTSYFCTDLLPTSASGKIDYAILSSSRNVPKLPKVEYGKALPSEDHLQVIIKAFCDALLVKEFSVDDDFFIMGGNSISAAHAAHNLGIDMRLLYVFPTPFKLLNGLLGQLSSHEIVSSSSPVSLKKVKALDDVPTSSDSSKVNLQDIHLIKMPLDAINVKGNPILSMRLDAKQTISHTEKDIGSPSSLSLLHAAPYGAVSNAHGDLWISNFGFPLEFSYTRCNQIMVRGESELSNKHQARLLVKVSRSTKGQLQELWKVLLKSCVDASPLVVYKDDSISLFIGSHSHIFLHIDAFSGCVRWEVKMEGRIECSAAITGDFSQVVVGCYKGKIYFLEYLTGNSLWEFQTQGEVKMQPVVDKYKKLLWCGSHDHCLYALDYNSRCCAYKISCGGSIYGSPSIDMVHNMIYVASTSGLVSGISTELGSQFKMVWSYESGAPIFGSVSMAPSSRNVICCLVDGRILALSSRGDVVWKVTIGGPLFAGPCISSALSSQALICSRDGSVYSLDVERGDILWEYNIHDPITASASVDEQCLFETDSSDPCDRLACVCSSSGRIHVLRINSNARQERLLHKGAVPQSRMVREFAVKDLQGEIFSSPIMIAGRIFVGCRDNHVYSVNVIN